LQLWKQCNDDDAANAPPCSIIQKLQQLSLELDLKGDVNVMNMRMAIERMQVVFCCQSGAAAAVALPIVVPVAIEFRTGHRGAKASHAKLHIAHQRGA
jgi:hypothetical protein